MSPNQRKILELQARVKLLESALFAAREENAKLKAGDDGSVVAQLRVSLADIERERDRARTERDDAVRRMGYAEYRAAELETKLARRERRTRKTVEPRISVPEEVWRRLVQLVHPDKHDNSESAKKATQWLMEVRP